jgi:hypothetical protein
MGWHVVLGQRVGAWVFSAAMIGVTGLSVAATTPAAGMTTVGAIRLAPNHASQPPGGADAASSAALGWASSNWSGYALSAPAASSFRSVSGQWKVPSVGRTMHATFSAAWVGIDGFSNNALIQTGTEQDYANGSAHYVAWWTTSAQGFIEQPIAEPVAPGDPMTAAISGTGTMWRVSLADHSKIHPWTFTTGSIRYTGPGKSAEWILEAPTVGGRQASLARYSSPTAFDPGTVNGASPKLGARAGGEMVQGGRVVSIPSSPDSDRDGFNISYGAVAPPSPAS